MPDVRAFVRFSDQHEETITMKYDGTINYDSSYYDGSYHSTDLTATNAYGPAVTATGTAQTIGKGSTGNYLVGKVIKVESDGFCTVAYAGWLTFSYLGGSVPVIGRGVTVDGAGNVTTPGGGARLATERGIVMDLDTTNLLAFVYLP